MTRILVIVSLSLATVFAQSADLNRLTDALEQAIHAGDWKSAAELSRSLKDAVGDARNRSMTASSGELTDSILNWLPADTETLVIAQRPFTILEESDRGMPDALTHAQAYVLGMFGAAESGRLVKALTGQTVRLAALGARKFANHEPDARGGLPLGMIAYQGCAVYAFARPLSEAVFARESDDSILGYRVWSSKGSQSDARDSEPYLITLILPDTMLACNDRDFFTEMVSRMGAPGNVRALPATLKEWKLLDRAAPLWAIRHFKSSRSEADPSYVLQRMNGKDPEATGLAVQIGTGSTVATARMIAKSNPWAEIVKDAQFHDAAQTRAVSEGVWELSVSGKPRDEAAIAVLVLMGILGFVVYL